jgi:UDP:flavonoid glycosyltransferase YjiC (YdhE family)
MRIALVSLIPDAGHVVPLFRIGESFAQAGHSTACFVPSEATPSRFHHELPSIELGDSTSPESTRARRSFAPAQLRSRHDPGKWYEYTAAIGSAGVAMYPRLVEALRGFRPDAIVADSHLFQDVYGHVARQLGVPLVLHGAAGSCSIFRGSQRPFGDARPLTRLLYPLASFAWSVFHEAKYAALPLLRSEYRQARQVVRDFSSRIPALDIDAPDVLQVSTGLGVLEREIPSIEFGAYAPKGMEFLGPVTSRPAPLSGELAHWLEQRGDLPIVYLSFGSMVQITKELGQLVVSALVRSGVAAVWAVPGEHTAAFAGMSMPTTVRLEASVPQRQVLSHASIRACITHGGSGTVQEALCAGKPLLCMPVLWDQFFNSEVAERLGVGLQLRWSGLDEIKLAESLRRLVEARALAESASRISRVLIAHEGGRKLRERVEVLVSRMSAAASGSA